MSTSPWRFLSYEATFAVACALLGLATSASAGDRLIVAGLTDELGETPVVVALETDREDGSYGLRLVGSDADLGPAQVFHDKGKAVLAAILPGTSKGKDVAYVLVRNRDSRGLALEAGESSGNLRVLKDGRLLAEYRCDGEPKPYLFPVIGPTGARFTRAYPMEKVADEDLDHPHQRSFWFTHGKVNGVDFWSETAGHGSIRETAKLTRIAGPALALIRTTNDWIGPDGKKVCEDERAYRFYNTRSSQVIDFDITIKATAGPVMFGDTKEGMFGLRVASTMDVKRGQGGRITNAEGVTDAAAWGKPSPWVDYTGPVAGETVGIAILNHPDSFRYPTTWHVRDYGLFAANPFGWHDFGLGRSGEHTLLPGGSISFRYRVVLHKGDTSSAQIPAVFQAYVSPPRARLE
jgi:hypothetical protein